MRKTIPAADVDFDERQEVITLTTATNLTAWKINQTWFNAELLPAKSKWTFAWAAYKNPATRTKVITFDKKEARNTYQPILSKLIDMLKSDPVVTPSDLEAMGIVIGKGRGNISNPGPKTRPDFDIDSSMIRQLKVLYRDQGAKSHAKPHGVHGVEIRWMILDSPPQDIDELVNSSFSTRPPFTLEFKEHERGKTVYFCLRWESTTGEKGPWSEIVMAIIP
jgi:hypothetical protein